MSSTRPWTLSACDPSRADAVTCPDGRFQRQVIAGHKSPRARTLSKPGYVGVSHAYRKAPPQAGSMSLCLTPMD